MHATLGSLYITIIIMMIIHIIIRVYNWGGLRIHDCMCKFYSFMFELHGPWITIQLPCMECVKVNNNYI